MKKFLTLALVVPLLGSSLFALEDPDMGGNVGDDPVAIVPSRPGDGDQPEDKDDENQEKTADLGSAQQKVQVQ